MTRTLISLLIIIFQLSACTLNQDTASLHQARCNELKHRILFSGATDDQNQAQQDRAQFDLLNKNYRNENC